MTKAEEQKILLHYKERELEDLDLKRNAMRSMVWYSLASLLLYPLLIIICDYITLSIAAKLLADIAGVYFVAIAGIVSAYFAANAYSKNKINN